MRRYRAIAAIAYLVLASLMGYAAAEDPPSEGTWIVLILLVTLVTGAVIGRWSLLLVALLTTPTASCRDPDLLRRRAARLRPRRCTLTRVRTP